MVGIAPPYTSTSGEPSPSALPSMLLGMGRTAQVSTQPRSCDDDDDDEDYHDDESQEASRTMMMTRMMISEDEEDDDEDE
mmetsp:Transcript_89645/g.187248  ORF Transcript_89645/g.187248 Transcript_89645/m.187248 type:complete len:80 (-) Transcript_89645:163-402(-)